MRRLLCAVAVLTLGAAAARAQFPYQPQQFNPQQFQPPPPYYPPGNPNQVVDVQGQTDWVLDPATGQWRRNSLTDVTHDSFNSPGRNTIVPGTLQNYTYTDASGRLVQGTRWLGQDGLWHGDHAETSQDAGGSSTVVNHRYARNPDGGRLPESTPSLGGATAGPAPVSPAVPAAGAVSPPAPAAGAVSPAVPSSVIRRDPVRRWSARGLSWMAVSLSGSSSTASSGFPQSMDSPVAGGGPSLPLVERRPVGL